MKKLDFCGSRDYNNGEDKGKENNKQHNRIRSAYGQCTGTLKIE